LNSDSHCFKDEIIISNSGGSHERPGRAAELFRERVAPRIIVSGLGDCKINRRLLIGDGVPSGVIEMENQSRTTKENAQFTIRLLCESNSLRCKARYHRYFMVSFAAGAGMFPSLCAGYSILLVSIVFCLRTG
jgi:hypothetical protein